MLLFDWKQNIYPAKHQQEFETRKGTGPEISQVRKAKRIVNDGGGWRGELNT